MMADGMVRGRAKLLLSLCRERYLTSFAEEPYKEDSGRLWYGVDEEYAPRNPPVAVS